MIDLDDLRKRPDAYKEAAKKKRCSVDIDQFLKLDTERREFQKKTDDLRAEKNAVSKKIPTMSDDEKKKALADMKEVSDDLTKMETALSELTEEWKLMQLRIPGIPLSQVPEGKDDSENVEIRTWGTKPEFSFEPKDHVALGEALDIIDIPRGVKIGGSRFYFLKGDGALLEMAVLRFTVDHLIKKGFTLFTPPVLANWDAMMGTSYFPGGEEQAYAVGVEAERGKGIESDALYLIGTSEVAVASYHSDEVLKKADLPKRYAGISNCFRREAGTYGKDTKGLYRIHQFQKVEQVILCENNADKSAELHKEILTNAEEVLQALELPYRVVDVCTGDMGLGQIYKNDIETWMPSRNAYGETHSCSTFHEFQSRRLNIKYEENGEKKFVHTLNNTCIASPRILIPLLEMYQNKDGTVKVPDVLVPYMNGKKVLEPAKN